MLDASTFIIIDTRNGVALYGIKGKTLKFSSLEVAEEVAIQFFGSGSDFCILNLNSITD